MLGAFAQINWQERAENYKRRVDLLEEELDIAKERIRSLAVAKEFDRSFTVAFGLTGGENQILSCLLARENATKEQIMHEIYANRIDDAPQTKIIDVYVCKLRKKLKKHGVDIATAWGSGYYMTKEMKDLTRSIAANIYSEVMG